MLLTNDKHWDEPWTGCGGVLDLKTKETSEYLKEIYTPALKKNIVGQVRDNLSEKLEVFLESGLREGIEEMPQFIKKQIQAEYEHKFGVKINNQQDRNRFIHIRQPTK